MAKRKTIAELISELEPAVRKSFLQAVDSITSNTQLRALEAAIRAGDIDAAMRILNMDASYFRPLDELLRQAHLAGADQTWAQAAAAALPKGYRVTGGFDARNFRAEEKLREWSSGRVTEIFEDTRQAVRDTLVAATERGTPPRQAALDLVGRIGPGGKRRGGVIGLDSHRAAQVRKVQDILSDPERIHEYFIGNKPRFTTTNRRYDAAIKRAIKEGKALPASTVAKLSEKHKARLLRDRGESIARTELLGSVHAAQDESLRQLVEQGQVDQSAITLEWDSSADRYTRKSHRKAHGQKRQQGEMFLVGGHLLRHPGDQNAPAKEVINCRCFLRVRINFVKGLKNRLTPVELSAVRRAM